jgi:hypothetical protein
MAAVLACGPDTALSHDSAAALLGIAKTPTTPIHVSTLGESRARDGIVVHRRQELNTTKAKRIPTTSPAQTLIDLSTTWPKTASKPRSTKRTSWDSSARTACARPPSEAADAERAFAASSTARPSA